MPEASVAPQSLIVSLVQSVLKGPSSRRPVVTVSWAQSNDGSIAGPGGERVTLSGPESMRLTHRLRSMHAGILVGIGTVLSDDPQLTTRLVPGASPQPIVLDSRLRLPLASWLVARTDKPPWVFHAIPADAARRKDLLRRGARLFAVDETAVGLDLGTVLSLLAENGIDSVMVEGGARVLHSFLAGRHADQAVITVSPGEIEGIRIFASEEDRALLLRFTQETTETWGRDSVRWGKL